MQSSQLSISSWIGCSRDSQRKGGGIKTALSPKTPTRCVCQHSINILSWREISGICVNRNILNQPPQSEEFLVFPVSLRYEDKAPRHSCICNSSASRGCSQFVSQKAGTPKKFLTEAAAAWDCHLHYKLALSTLRLIIFFCSCKVARVLYTRVSINRCFQCTQVIHLQPQVFNPFNQNCVKTYPDAPHIFPSDSRFW